MKKIPLWFCSDTAEVDSLFSVNCHVILGGETPERDVEEGFWCFDGDVLTECLLKYDIDMIEKTLGVKIPKTFEDDPLKLVLTVDERGCIDNVNIDEKIDDYASFL